MSVCTTCFNAGIYIASCNDGLTFGVVEVDTDYKVFIQNNATQRIRIFPVISDVDGMIEITDVLLDPLQGYTIWVTLDEPNSPRVALTIDTIEYTCIDFSVVQTDDSSGVINLIE
jgi:hypothetical protein